MSVEIFWRKINAKNVNLDSSIPGWGGGCTPLYGHGLYRYVKLQRVLFFSRLYSSLDMGMFLRKHFFIIIKEKIDKRPS